MQPSRDQRIKFAERGGGADGVRVQQVWVLRGFTQCLGLQRHQKSRGINVAVESAVERITCSSQIQRGGNTGRCSDQLAGGLTLFPQPFQQRIAA